MTPTAPYAAEVKEAELSASELRRWANNEPERLVSDGFIVTQLEDFEPIPIGRAEEKEEMEDHVPRQPTRHDSCGPRAHTPPLAQKEQDEEARFLTVMKELVERTNLRTNGRASTEITRLGCELNTANATISKTARQIATINNTVTDMSRQLATVLAILRGNNNNPPPKQNNGNQGTKAQ